MPAKLETYLEQGLTQEHLGIALELEKLNHGVPVQLEDAGKAYRTALGLADQFRDEIARLAEILKVERYACRPGTGVKNAERILLKYAQTELVSIDMLGAKLVVSNVSRMYQVASLLPEYLNVVGFKDRVVEPVVSGYQDLQFQVLFKRHIVEVKFLHTLFDEADTVEHKIYEITRSIGNESNSPAIEGFVREELLTVSKKLYNGLWLRILAQEKEQS